MSKIPQNLLTPDSLESHLGTLSFTDGAPSPDTVETLRDHLDYLRAVDAFMKGHQGASTWALRQGFIEAGAEDNEFIVFSGLMAGSSSE